MDIKPEEKILVVDDLQEMTETLQDILENEGYQTLAAYNGTQAIEMAKLHDFKLILMDVKLPDFNGVEAFIKIKKFIPDVKVIMMTAFSVKNLLNKARKEGAYGVLYKPLDIKELIKMIKEDP